MQVMVVAYQYKAQNIAGVLEGHCLGVFLSKHQSGHNPFSKTP